MNKEVREMREKIRRAFEEAGLLPKLFFTEIDKDLNVTFKEVRII
jgi:hypothetical protein